ncbi:drug/metabolite transporter (DMT)-like permease [Herbaspirillum sp. Sphag1AN]|uniref:DMT family transporter n=1 Tax=unclassified Herbaspirillum TaxID=2624150 RepID=UPI001609BFF2|nr:MULTISPECIES: DMT family transporter [unclassified Herbaspirillum]MBB3213142.1 drug/metabolite transporter (DMT)-like permease [Herbaspirillum sp. Sphag1AN]MBB3246339.1 drug/metabolite transporter (DMT)-like permease [Herbaspirillum sp. Sphag64]
MRPSSLSSRQAIVLLSVVVLIWGTTWSVNKASLQYLSPIWAAAIRCIIGTLVLLVLSVGRGRFKLPHRGDLPVVCSLGLLHMSAYSMLCNIGMQHVGAGRSVVLAYTTPMWVAPGARLFLGEAFTVRRAIGAGLGLLGLLLIFNPLAFDWNNQPALLGNGLILLGAMFWAASILYMRGHRWIGETFDLLFWQALLASCVLSACAWFVEGPPQVDWNPALTMQVLYSGAFGIAIAYWAMNKVNHALPAMTTSLGLLGVPVFGIVCSSVTLGEPIETTLLIAMAMIVVGIAIGALPSRQEQKKNFSSSEKLS